MKKAIILILALTLVVGSSLTALAAPGGHGPHAFALNPNHKVTDLRTDKETHDTSEAQATERNKASQSYPWQFKQQGKVRVNGTNVNFDVPPVVRDGRTLVPLRAIAAALKADVSWDPEKGVATITRGSDTIQFIPGDDKFYLNGVEAQLDVPLYLVGNRTFVPLRALAELFGTHVGYDDKTGDISVDDGKDGTSDDDSTNTSTTTDQTSATTPTDSTSTSGTTGQTAPATAQ